MRHFRSLIFLAGAVLLVTTLLSLAACSELAPFLAFSQDWDYSFDDGGVQFPSEGSLLGWVSTHIAYASDSSEWGHEEYWASPEQTFNAGKGDCEDKAILFMYFAYTRELMREVYLVGIVLPNGKGHALVRQDDRYFDPTRGVSYPVSSQSGTVMYRLNYGQVMYIASHDHAQARGGLPLCGALTGNAIMRANRIQGESRHWGSHFGLTRSDNACHGRDLEALPGTMDDYR
jgi:hypothetical protein